MAAIRVEGLRREFGELTAVEDCTFTVEEGELFGLVGPNGAGKSTLINMLVTLLPPTAGRAIVDGHDVRTETQAVRSSLGIVFQETAIDEELTAVENLAVHARLYGLGGQRRRRRTREVLELVGLAAVGDERVKTFSGGMVRRLEIARGLLHEPAVLFLDEPTVGLDPRTRRDTWAHIETLNRSAGATIVLTTHYIEEAAALCDRVAIMDDGEIAAIDSPDALTAALGGDVVALSVQDDAAPEPLVRALEAVPWTAATDRRDGALEVTVDSGTRRIAELVRLADETGVALSAVEVHEPTLERAFLSLTGSRLETAEGPDG